MKASRVNDHVDRAAGSRKRVWQRKPLPLAALVASTALGLAACGGGGSPSPGVAGSGSTTSTVAAPSANSGSLAPPAGFEAHALEYSRCMRAHGIAKFPDPTSNGIAISRSSGIDPNSPQFQAADHACKSLLPGGNLTPAQQAAANAKALRYARCMRSHGFPNFPDPNGHGVISLPETPGLEDSSSPLFQRAQQACQQLENGFLMAQGTPGAGQGSTGK
jgi:hypothetical protein